MAVIIRTIVIGYLAATVVTLAAGTVATIMLEVARRRSPMLLAMRTSDDVAMQKKFWELVGFEAPV